MKKFITICFFVATVLFVTSYKGILEIIKSRTVLFQTHPVPITSIVYENDVKKEYCQSSRAYFNTTVLVVVYNYPYYDTVPLLQQFYGPVFSKLFFCGPISSNETHTDINQVDINRGIFGYECLGEAIRLHHGYEGYFYINDDVILNYWNLFRTEFNKNHIWKSNNQFGKVDADGAMPTEWYWWVSPYGFKNGRQAVDELEVLSKSFKVYENLYKTFLQNGNSSRYLLNGRSDILFIPRKFAMKYQEISRIFFQHRVFLEIAIPTILNFLDESSEIGTLNGYYIPGDVRKKDPRVIDSRYFWSLYLQKPELWFIHPFKLHHERNKNRELNIALLKHILIAKTNQLMSC